MRSDPRTLRRSLAAGLVALVGAGGCALVLGIDDKPPFPPDASTPLVPDLCAHTYPPDANGNDSTEFSVYVLAARSIDVNPPDGGTELGFDLDHQCTCEVDAAAPSCVSASPTCDGTGGIDNGFLKLQTATLITSAGFRNDDVNCGRATVLGLVSGYNGRANDDTVSFAFVVSPGIDEPHFAGEDASTCNGPGLPVVYPPRWDGTDKWSSDTNFVQYKSTTPYLQEVIPGYVSNWKLVAQAKGDQTVTAPFIGAVVQATQLTVVADLEPLDPDGGALEKDAGTRASLIRISFGQFTGRITPKAAAQAVSSFSVRGYGYVCPGNPLFDSVVKDFCANLDVASDPTQDFDASACNAITGVARFVAEPAIMTESKDAGPAAPSPCGEIPDHLCGN